MQTTFLGHRLASPIVLSSGPMTASFDYIEEAMQAGAGAVTTQSIRLYPAVQPKPALWRFSQDGSYLNAYQHSEQSWQVWIEEILPRARERGYPVIAKTGYTLEDVSALVPCLAKAGAIAIEIIAPTDALMCQMVARAKALTDLPVVAKMSGRWPDMAKAAKDCVTAGANALTVMDTPGPALLLHGKTGRPVLGGEGPHGRGFGYISGPAIFPLTVAQVAKMRMCYPSLPLIGVGGVQSGDDAWQLLLAGACLVGVQTLALDGGFAKVARLVRELDERLEQSPFSDWQQACGFSIQYLRNEETGCEP